MELNPINSPQKQVSSPELVVDVVHAPQEQSNPIPPAQERETSPELVVDVVRAQQEQSDPIHSPQERVSSPELGEDAVRTPQEQGPHSPQVELSPVIVSPKVSQPSPQNDRVNTLEQQEPRQPVDKPQLSPAVKPPEEQGPHVQVLPNINKDTEKQIVFSQKLQALNWQISELKRRYQEEEKKNGQSEAYNKLVEAHQAGTYVFETLETAGRNYFAKKISHEEFLACRDKEEFKNSLNTLKEHRGAKGALEALINVLLYLPRLLVSLWTGKMTTLKLNTESINKVDEALDSAQKAAPSA